LTHRAPGGRVAPQGMGQRERYLIAELAAALVLLPGHAVAHTGSGLQVPSPAPSTSFGPASCPGDPINPTHVVTGQFDSSLQGSFVDLPFDVPAGTTAVRVRYCYDPPIGIFTKHTPRRHRENCWDSRRAYERGDGCDGGRTRNAPRLPGGRVPHDAAANP
jgi:hypothetical protein